MKIFVKTLKGTHFEIEVKPEDTVADVKKKIETVQGSDVYPAAKQMLIYQGKVLKDGTTLEENKVAEKSSIVIMITKSKTSSGESSSASSVPKAQAPQSSVPSASVPVAPTSAPAPAPVAPTSAPAPVAPTSAPAPVAPASTPASASAPEAAVPPSATVPTSASAPEPAGAAVPQVTSVSESDVYGQAASNLLAGSTLEVAIQQILDMGGGTWDRDMVVRALRAAYNNPERAVDYLCSGIPESVEAAPPLSRTPPSGQVTDPPVQPQQAAQAAQAAPHPSTGPNANPLDLFPRGIPPVSSTPGGANTLDFLRNSQQFQALRTMVQSNPQILQPMLQELGKQNPHLMRLIQEHQADFLRLINEPVEGGEENILGQFAAAMPLTVQVTPEEREAIERLEAMGFDRALVLEVFIACNRDEELTANYLLDHIHEFED